MIELEAISVNYYPREKGVIDVTAILSELGDVERLRQYYQESVSFILHRL